MCVINTGASTSDEIWFGIVRKLSQTARFGPVVLFCEAASAEFVRGALQAGARGVVPASTNPAVALKSLDLTLHGGIFVPPSVLDLLQSSEPSREPGEAPPGDPEQLPDLSGRTTGDHGAAPRPVAAAPRVSPRQTRPEQPGDSGAAAESDEPDLADLTPRQMAVLDHLGKAWSNKEIARVLDTTEATVKLHVRQVMRKLGAKNRTEAALIAARRELAKYPAPRQRTVSGLEPVTPARKPIYQPMQNHRDLHAATLIADAPSPAHGFLTAGRGGGDTRAAEHLRRMEKSAPVHFPGIFPGRPLELSVLRADAFRQRRFSVSMAILLSRSNTSCRNSAPSSFRWCGASPPTARVLTAPGGSTDCGEAPSRCTNVRPDCGQARRGPWRRATQSARRRGPAPPT
ncbi:response regulator transcription factor [Yangia mangrovi]|uniref:Response regulator transcription factor n=2 Tax=Alloyangia mangrovi TaxID=1779329 RepID=A0ABT2KNQ4_9RHOB|nr:response regulator transcription factor [Alloyangia mangrovi]